MIRLEVPQQKKQIWHKNVNVVSAEGSAERRLQSTEILLGSLLDTSSNPRLNSYGESCFTSISIYPPLSDFPIQSCRDTFLKVTAQLILSKPFPAFQAKQLRELIQVRRQGSNTHFRQVQFIML